LTSRRLRVRRRVHRDKMVHVFDAKTGTPTLDVRHEAFAWRYLIALSEARDCDRTVIREARNLDEHRGLRTHIKASVWKAKSLTACGLRRLEVGQCGSPGLLSKRAPSTTRPSLRFRINELRAVLKSVAQNPLTSSTVSRFRLYSAVCGLPPREHGGNCDRPPNALRRLTAIPSGRVEVV
jgi:hypothetical protein